MIRKTAVALLVGLVAAAGAGSAAAQVKTIPGDSRTVVATVEAVESSSRTVTLREADGALHDITVPRSVERFPEVKVGDRVRVTYYETLTLRKKAPGEADVDTLRERMTPTPGTRPAGTAASQRTITAVVDAIDPTLPSISFKGPRGWAYSTKVKDRAALAQVVVGDRVDITWTEAMVVAMEPAK
jgi:hypothetical protein